MSENNQLTKEEQIWLKEREIWWNFVFNAWRHRYTLVGFDLVAVGTLVGLATQFGSIFLLIASTVSSALGIVWVGESQNITKVFKVDLPETSSHLAPLFGKGVHLPPSRVEILRESLGGQNPGAAVGLLVFFVPSLVSLIVGSISGYWQAGDFCTLFGLGLLYLGILVWSGIVWIRQYRNT
jgi:hypothetical protein